MCSAVRVQDDEQANKLAELVDPAPQSAVPDLDANFLHHVQLRLLLYLEEHHAALRVLQHHVGEQAAGDQGALVVRGYLDPDYSAELFVALHYEESGQGEGC